MTLFLIRSTNHPIVTGKHSYLQNQVSKTTSASDSTHVPSESIQVPSDNLQVPFDSLQIKS